jgi:hypothetical protein
MPLMEPRQHDPTTPTPTAVTRHVVELRLRGQL